MKDRLSGYREAMDQSVFKDEKFTARHKQEVFAEIKKGKRKRNDWFPRSMSLALGIVFLLIGGYFLFEVITNPVNQADPPPQSGPATTGNETVTPPIDKEDENNDEESPESDEQSLQEYPYKDIRELFDSYELPEEGRVPGSEFSSSVTYENGYTFDSKTKAMTGREHTDEGPAEPTEGQKIGVITGLLKDAAAIQEPEYRTISNESGQMYHPLSRFEEINELNDFEPLEAWLAETKEILKKVDDSETLEENKEFYLEAYERLQEMSLLIEGE